MSFLFSNLPIDVERMISKNVEYTKNYNGVIQNLKTIHNKVNENDYHTIYADENQWEEYEWRMSQQNRGEQYWIISYSASPVEVYWEVDGGGFYE